MDAALKFSEEAPSKGEEAKMGTDAMMLALEEDGDAIGECSVDEFCAVFKAARIS